jgi:hypothetical protein
MSFEESLRSVSLLADASLAGYTGPPGAPGSADPNAGKMYRIVKVTGKSTVGLCTADEDLSVGVLQNKPQVTGQAATVGIRGITNVIAGANDLNAGEEVSSDGEGRAIVAVQGKVVAGVILADSTTVGEAIPMLIRPGVKA